MRERTSSDFEQRLDYDLAQDRKCLCVGLPSIDQPFSVTFDTLDYFSWVCPALEPVENLLS
jgi:hypothetical protein